MLIEIKVAKKQYVTGETAVYALDCVELYEKIRLHSRRRIFYGVVCIKWTLDHFLILNAPIPG